MRKADNECTLAEAIDLSVRLAGDMLAENDLIELNELMETIRNGCLRKKCPIIDSERLVSILTVELEKKMRKTRYKGTDFVISTK